MEPDEVAHLEPEHVAVLTDPIGAAATADYPVDVYRHGPHYPARRGVPGCSDNDCYIGTIVRRADRVS